MTSSTALVKQSKSAATCQDAGSDAPEDAMDGGDQQRVERVVNSLDQAVRQVAAWIFSARWM